MKTKTIAFKTLDVILSESVISGLLFLTSIGFGGVSIKKNRWPIKTCKFWWVRKLCSGQRWNFHNLQTRTAAVIL